MIETLAAKAPAKLIVRDTGEESRVSDRFTFESMPRLESARLVLREADPGRDLEGLFELFADPEVARFTDTGPFTTLDEAVEVMAWISDIFTRQRGMRWVIAPASAEERLIGTCGFNVWRQSNNSAEIGYDLARPHWGQGLMTEALGVLLRFGFERMDLNRVEADVTVGNDGSARVLEKLGFQEEGVLRQRGFWKGDYHDLRLFSLLREEWPG